MAPHSPNKRTAPPIIAATINTFLLSKSPAITTPTHSYSASTLSTHEVPPKSRTPLPDLGGFRQDHPCGGTEVAAECWLAVGLSWPGGTKKGRRSKRRQAPKNATSPRVGGSLDEGRSSLIIQPNSRKGGFYLHGDGSPRFIATFKQSSNKRPRLIHPRSLISGRPAGGNLGGPLVCLGLPSPECRTRPHYQ